jgi:hypothetical protein
MQEALGIGGSQGCNKRHSVVCLVQTSLEVFERGHRGRILDDDVEEFFDPVVPVR